MYQLFQVDGQTGMFSLVTQSEQLADCVQQKPAAAAGKFVILYDFSTSRGFTEQEETKIILELIGLSDGEITRVTKGVTVSKKADAVCCGPGNCYCVVAGGSRYCETYYCNASGYCWVVRCNIPCGC